MKWSKLYWVINFANGVWAKKKLWLGKSRIFYDMDETLHLKWHFMIYPYGGILWPICTLELNWVDHIIVCIFKKLFTSRSKYWGTNIFLFTRMWIFSSSKHRYLKTNFFWPLETKLRIEHGTILTSLYFQEGPGNYPFWPWPFLAFFDIMM